MVDDASTDDSREILKSFNGKVKTEFLSENLGLAGASNVGISKVQGRYVVRVDSDDYVHPDFLRVLLLGFEFHGKDAEAITVDYWNVSPAGELLHYGDSAVNPIACGIAFKVDAIEQIGFYNSKLRLHEEVDLRKRFLHEGFKFTHLNLPLYRYVNHESSLSRRALI